MSFATTIGHTFTDVVAHHGGVHRPRRRATPSAPTLAPNPERRRRSRSAAEIQAEVTDDPHLDQWRAAFTLAICLNR
jgi:hypothetical protein